MDEQYTQTDLDMTEHDAIAQALAILTAEDIDQTALSQFINQIEDSLIADVFESIPESFRLTLWRQLAEEKIWPTIRFLQAETARNLLRLLSETERLQVQSLAAPEDIRIYAESLPRAMLDAILLDQDESTLAALQQALSYEDTRVGRYLNKSIIRVRPTVSISSLAQRKLKKGRVNAVFVTDENGQLLGCVPMSVALSSSDERPVSDIMEDIQVLDHEAALKDTTHSLDPEDQHAWYPVVKEGKVIGCFPVSVLIWHIQDTLVDVEVSDQPSAEEDLFTPIPKAARLRAFWLLINLATAFLASWVIGNFEVALKEVVALAILMPVVASMGGIAGSQTLAVSLRGLALNHISKANLNFILLKETKIAAFNGVLLGLFIAFVVGYWFDSIILAITIFIAIVLNSLAAASSGTLIPFWLKKLNIDPAISGSVILTTVTDVVGFFVFLGLGSLLLLG